MDSELKHGPTMLVMKENTEMGKRMVKELLIFLTGQDMKVNRVE